MPRRRRKNLLQVLLSKGPRQNNSRARQKWEDKKFGELMVALVAAPFDLLGAFRKSGKNRRRRR
jgi:hypothetical protein